jgi:uncharacterized membrane protein
MTRLVFDFPLGWQAGLPLAALLLGLGLAAYRRRGLPPARAWTLTTLRAIALLVLVWLAGRPTWVSGEPPSSSSRPVALLIDSSESMSLQDGDRTRYAQALEFAREHLLPALKAAALGVEGFLFAEDAEPADGPRMTAARPQGRRTNLGGAISRAVGLATTPPLAVIALTDGGANVSADNARGLSALTDQHAPFIGVAFGSDTGVQTFSLRRIEAPALASTNTVFRVAAELELNSTAELPALDLLLLRDGRLLRQKALQPGKGSRRWIESFPVTEAEQGTHVYTVQFLPPNVAALKCPNTSAAASVVVADERELRVLYVQGALTWDYKFVALALKGDPSVKLTGLTRTSKQSIFRQNVESASELQSGFPTSADEIAPFRVVVLACLTPADLSPAQQELLGRFCGEFGGGVLMIGGPATFHAAWAGSRLEQLLPVVLAEHPGVQELDRPFRLRLTPEAAREPLFQLAGDRASADVWAQLPAFSQYGRVEAPKPGAQVWAVHPEDDGPNGKRVLMAAQRFGAGMSAVICVQNFWRWRLARECEPQHFDRFWRQLLRFLGEASRQEVTIHLADQELQPHMDVQCALERRPNSSAASANPVRYSVRVEDQQHQRVLEQSVELMPSRPVALRFRAETPGLYTVEVKDARQVPVATRTIDIREENLEFRDTARNLETLRQWASVSDGFALKVEECADARALVSQITAKVEQLRRAKPVRLPAGINGWTLALVLGSLAAEWTLRKRWLVA